MMVLAETTYYHIIINNIIRSSIQVIYEKEFVLCFQVLRFIYLDKYFLTKMFNAFHRICDSFKLVAQKKIENK